MASYKNGKIVFHDETYFRKKLWLYYGIFCGLIILIFTCISLGIFGFMPSFEELENPQSNLASEVISADQKVLGTYYVENRSNATYEELSPDLIHALIATEDERFYQHSGIDPISLGRVFTKTIIGGNRSSGGGSTITQQLAKNLFPRTRQSKISLAFRKLKEWVIAIKLERHYSKKEILAMYLNTVDFGNNSYGIKTATNTYFRKHPSELTVDEAAVMVGLLKAPTYYSPVKNPKNALRRRNVVLYQMLKADYITDAEYEKYSALPIDMSHFAAPVHSDGIATYFREYIRAWLTDWCNNHRKSDGTKYNLYKDGLKIYTTINYTMQKYAEEAVNQHMSQEVQPAFFNTMKNLKNAPFVNISDNEISNIMKAAMKNSDRYRNMKADGYSEKEIEKAFHTPTEMTLFSWNGNKDTVMTPWDSLLYYKWFLHCGLMSIEPQTGYVRAYVGDFNYKYFQYDNVTQGKRQVGSTFKPFVYAVAMQEGEFSPCSEVPNVKVCIPIPGNKEWCPKNSDKKREGEMVTLKWALANSVNYVSAYLIKRFSPATVVNMAHKMGIKSDIEAVPSICLGTTDLSVCEMTNAIATIANKGIHVDPIFVTRIEDKNGIVIDNFSPSQNEAMNEQTAFLMTELMKGVVEGGTGVRLRYKYNLTAPIAGKTGTTQNNSDGWFMGLTPTLATGVWVGGEVRSIHFRSTALGQGASTALPIWAIYMKKIYEDPKLNFPKDDFDRPSKPLSVELDCSKYNSGNEHNFEDDF